MSAGNVKREITKERGEEGAEGSGDVGSDSESIQRHEQQILVQSVCDTMVPKLVRWDVTFPVGSKRRALTQKPLSGC